jgi:hypothetical protein
MLSCVMLLVTACAKKEEASAEKPKTTPSSTAQPTRDVPDIGVSWKAPADFEPVAPTSNMRKAGYRIKPVVGDTEPADLGVFYFGPGQGGSIEENVKRWLKQFEDAEGKEKRSERTVNGLRHHMIDAEGTYKSGMPGEKTTAKKKWALIGAIVESPNGNHFFKLVGPKDTVEDARQPFMEMLDSIKPK